MTEASISDEWDREQDAASLFFEIIKSHFVGCRVNVHVQEPASWSQILDQLPAFDMWLKDKVKHITFVTGEVVLTNNDLALQLTLSPSSEPLEWIICNRSEQINDYSKEMQATLRTRIQNKINRRKNGNLKKTPAVRPCCLVIYPNHDFGADLEAVVREFFEHPLVEVSSHFEEVWLSGEKHLIRLV